MQCNWYFCINTLPERDSKYIRTMNMMTPPNPLTEFITGGPHSLSVYDSLDFFPRPVWAGSDGVHRLVYSAHVVQPVVHDMVATSFNAPENASWSFVLKNGMFIFIVDSQPFIIYRTGVNLMKYYLIAKCVTTKRRTLMMTRCLRHYTIESHSLFDRGYTQHSFFCYALCQWFSEKAS